METLMRCLWLVLAALGVTGVCFGFVRLFESAYLFATAHGNREQIAEAKDIFLSSILGSALIAVSLAFAVYQLS